MQAASGDHIAKLLARRKEMEISRGDGDLGNFLCGWQCENPFAGQLLEAVRQHAERIDHVPYAYLEDDPILPGLIQDMHESFGEPRPASVFCGAGAMSLIFTFAAYLKHRNVTEVYYIPPIYFSFHSALRLLGIRARPVSAYHGFESKFKMNLPNRQAVLIVSDPIWYAAQPLPTTVTRQIVDWQCRTDSIVFVDGSFQYMLWNKSVDESSSQLGSDRTIRLISPTKSLAVSGYRFAYCLLPSVWRTEFSHTYTNIYGSANADSIAFGYLAIREMRQRTLTDKLVELISDRHRRLREANAIESVLQPHCGFFVFERVNARLPEGYLVMGGDYFDQARFPEYVRVNLLSPSFHLIAQ